ncbi:MAG: WYL domain-containing protein [Flavobacteriales bacterium]|nr:WYL domain-containing protein [Flavobacteriales bacterium]
MATNKNAYLRYRTLDKCFRNFGRKYYFEELLEEINEALSSHDPNTSGVQIRQLREDIKFMRSEEGFTAPIETYRDGRKGYYRYSDKNYSISNSGLNVTEAEQLGATLAIMSRFEGRPGFEWIGETSSILANHFDISGDNRKVISYETNIDYKGYDFITPLFNAIVNKRVLNATYEPFNKPAFNLTFHPYYLKQYNNRWFVLGYNEELNIDAWNMPLDRIVTIEEVEGNYRSNIIDWEDWFSDMIGVTRKIEDKPQEIKMIFSSEIAPYIETKPLHQTQKARRMKDGSLEVRIEVIPNRELTSLINSFGTEVQKH